jgi:hypothetical protein
VAAALLTLAASLAAQAPADSLPLRWGLAPPILPPGARLAVVAGDPTQPGWSTIELIMPDGYRMPPHSHPVDEFVEVKEGTLLVASAMSWTRRPRAHTTTPSPTSTLTRHPAARAFPSATDGYSF